VFISKFILRTSIYSWTMILFLLLNSPIILLSYIQGVVKYSPWVTYPPSFLITDTVSCPRYNWFLIRDCLAREILNWVRDARTATVKDSHHVFMYTNIIGFHCKNSFMFCPRHGYDWNLSWHKNFNLSTRIDTILTILWPLIIVQCNFETLEEVSSYPV